MKNSPQKSAFWQAMGIAWELGYIIAVPIVVLALVGRYLDRQFGTSPWLLLGGILVSIIISSAGLVWKFNKIIAKANKETPQ